VPTPLQILLDPVTLAVLIAGWPALSGLCLTVGLSPEATFVAVAVITFLALVGKHASVPHRARKHAFDEAMAPMAPFDC
jgi:hypothetical protein